MTDCQSVRLGVPDAPRAVDVPPTDIVEFDNFAFVTASSASLADEIVPGAKSAAATVPSSIALLPILVIAMIPLVTMTIYKLN